MSSFQTAEPLSTARDVAPVERVLTVFDNKTEQLVAQYPMPSFELESFRRQFAVGDDDPSMYHVYPVSPQDAEFMSRFLEREVAFDFNQNTYFVECNAVG